jgi:peptidoglycan hydrolase-like protein with peptidoglycan-binding domain
MSTRQRMRRRLVLVGAGVAVAGLGMASVGYAQSAPASGPDARQVDTAHFPDPATMGAGSGEPGPKPGTRYSDLEPLSPMKQTRAAVIAPGIEHSQYDDGVNEADVLTVDLTEPSVGLTYTWPGAVAAKTVMTDQAKRVGAVAAVNGDFFNIGDTEAPRGVGLANGELLNAPAAGWNETAMFSQAAEGWTGRLSQVSLDATVTMPGGEATANYLNSPEVGENGLVIFTPIWGEASRASTVEGGSGIVEVVVTNGEVTDVNSGAGSGAIPEGTVVLVGREAGGTAIGGLQVGDQVDVSYGPAYEGDEVQVGITGNLVLMRDGVIDVPDHPLNPRTGVGFSADGKTLWLVALDGRSSSSAGMTYAQFGQFFKDLGADDALNLDGGGSTDMVAITPGEVELAVENVPSDGTQRAVPNGLGLTSTAFPAECVMATYGFASYPDLATGASGDEVAALRCLLKRHGFFDGAPGSEYDADTATAVKAFQADRGLEESGAVDAATWTAVLSAGTTPLLQNGSSGVEVGRLQRALNAAVGAGLDVDGAFGPATQAAVEDYQTAVGLEADGVVGPNTWGALQSGQV